MRPTDEPNGDIVEFKFWARYLNVARECSSLFQGGFKLSLIRWSRMPLDISKPHRLSMAYHNLHESRPDYSRSRRLSRLEENL